MTVGAAVLALPTAEPARAAVADTHVTLLPAPPPSTALPVGLELPSAGIATVLAGIDLDAAGALVPPADPAKAGWYRGSAVPGETGPAVISGHVDWAGAPGVFARLDEVAVRRSRRRPRTTGRRGGSPSPASSATRRPRSRRRRSTVPPGRPAAADHLRRRRSTATGGSYRDNVVVFARPA